MWVKITVSDCKCNSCRFDSTIQGKKVVGLISIQGNKTNHSIKFHCSMSQKFCDTWGMEYFNIRFPILSIYWIYSKTETEINWWNTFVDIYQPTIPKADTSLFKPGDLPLLLPNPIMFSNWWISCLLYSTLSSTSISSFESVLSIFKTRNLVCVLLDPIR